MISSAYNIRYGMIISFYLCISFILFIIVKNDQKKIFTSNINYTNFKLMKHYGHSNLNSFDQNTTLRIRDICYKYNISAPLNNQHFLYSEKYRMVFCWIRKVASTSFTKLFSDLNNRHVAGNYYKEISYLMPKSNNILHKIVEDDNIYKLLVVRHPFERLVSCYRDRIADPSKFSAQAWIYAKQIFKLFRPHLLIGNHSVGNSIHQIFDEKKRLKIIPTFAEFIKWLLTQDPLKDDPHWIPFTIHCSLCEIKYNKILYLNNSSILEIKTLLSNIDRKSDIRLFKLEKTKNGYTDFAQACQYFKELTKKDIIKLYNRYKIDFELLHYDFQDYLKCAEDYNF